MESAAPREPALSDDYVYDLVPLASDIDELGHVSNLVYVRWLQDAAKAHSAAVGWDFAAYQAAGGVFVVRRYEIDYLAPAFAGQTIRVTTRVMSFQGASSERRTEMVRVEDGRALLKATTQWVYVGTNGRPKRIPEELVRAFRSRTHDADDKTRSV